ncbi:MAG: hypothetical protein ABID04_03920 [Patescibacteria group bacterium]
MRTNNSGQTALIVLAVMAIAMTLGLSVSQRVTEDVKTSHEQSQSDVAFSAAEAGIEEALRVIKQGGDKPDIDPSDFGVNQLLVNIQTQGDEATFTYPNSLQSGQSAVIWLCNHTVDGVFTETGCYSENSIDIHWQNQSAIEVVYYYNAGGGNYKIRRFAFDSNDGRRISSGGSLGNGNNFSTSDSSGVDGFDDSASLDLAGGTPLFLVVRSFYGSTKVMVEASSGNLPVQGQEIISSGSIDLGDTNIISRKIRVFRSWPIPPDFVFQSVFAGGGVSGG